MSEKHVAVCDNCDREEDLQGEDKLGRFPAQPPEGWIIAGKVEEIYRTGNPPAHFCSYKCLSEWADVEAKAHPQAVGA